MTPAEFSRRMAALAAPERGDAGLALALLLEALCAQGYGEGSRLYENAFGRAGERRRETTP